MRRNIEVAIVGTQGIPANYGGFESLVENLTGENCPDGVHYTVFCSSKDMPGRPTEYKGATLKYVGFHANGSQSVVYDIVSLCRTLRGYDVVLLLGVSGGLFLPVYRLLSRKKLIINIDGQEWKRDKWNKFAKYILRISEKLAVRHADIVIADNKGIQNYVTETYGRPSELIAYGGDHAARNLTDEKMQEILKSYGLEKNGYTFALCRIEPENNVETVLQAFTKTDKTLVFIGNWNRSPYSRALKERFGAYSNIRILDAIYDLDTLYALRSCCSAYVHGHSAGGTNPSLVEAMHFGMPIVAYDVVYNRETTENAAYYFRTPEDLIRILNEDGLDGSRMKEIARRRYTWRHVSDQYVKLFDIT